MVFNVLPVFSRTAQPCRFPMRHSPCFCAQKVHCGSAGQFCRSAGSKYWLSDSFVFWDCFRYRRSGAEYAPGRFSFKRFPERFSGMIRVGGKLYSNFTHTQIYVLFHILHTLPFAAYRVPNIICIFIRTSFLWLFCVNPT